MESLILVSGKKLGDIKLDAHPESFQLEKKGDRTFVNLPDSRKIAVVDRKKKAVVGKWETGGALANFPMALDGDCGFGAGYWRQYGSLLCC